MKGTGATTCTTELMRRIDQIGGEGMKVLFVLMPIDR